MIYVLPIKFKKFLSIVAFYLVIFCMLSNIFSLNTFAEDKHNEDRIIVSLGDSYSSGEGVEPFYGQNDENSIKVQNQDWLAHRSEKSWCGKLTLDGVNGTMSENRDKNWFFVATSGATTHNLKNEQCKKYDLGPELRGKYYIDKQLDVFKRLGNSKAEYVTVSIGGNDAMFSDVITKAVSDLFNPGELYDFLNSVWKNFYYDSDNTPSIRNRLFQAYNDIQKAAGAQAKIIVVGYPKLFDVEGALFNIINKTEAALINDSVSRFNNEIDSIVKNCKNNGMKICFVSVEDAFDGHEAYSNDPFLNEIIPVITGNQDLSKKMLVSPYSMHPNINGIKAYAECVQAKIDEIEKDGGTIEWPLMSSSEERDIALVLDVSGSMDGKPLDETKKASKEFINTILKNEASIGVVAYDNNSMCLADFCKNEVFLTTAIKNVNSGGGTNIEAGLSQAYSMLKQSKAKKRIMILMSDGEPNEGKMNDELVELADTIKDEGIYIYTLGFFGSLYDKTSPQLLLERIASEGCHFEVENAEDLVFFFGDIADQINGQKYIYVRIACPVDVTVKYNDEILCSAEERQNTRTSFGTLTFEDNKKLDNENDNRIKVLRLKEGTNYDIQINGIERGYMNYTIGFMDDAGEYSDLREFTDIKITKRTIIDTVAGNSNKTILNVDEDGDGKYDLKYRATENSKGELINYSYINYLVICIVILVFVLMIKKKIKNTKRY